MSFAPASPSCAAMMGEMHKLMCFFGLGLWSAPDTMPHLIPHDLVLLCGALLCPGVFLAWPGSTGSETGDRRASRGSSIIEWYWPFSVTDWGVCRQTAHTGTFQ